MYKLFGKKKNIEDEKYSPSSMTYFLNLLNCGKTKVNSNKKRIKIGLPVALLFIGTSIGGFSLDVRFSGSGLTGSGTSGITKN